MALIQYMNAVLHKAETFSTDSIIPAETAGFGSMAQLIPTIPVGFNSAGTKCVEAAVEPRCVALEAETQFTASFYTGF